MTSSPFPLLSQELRNNAELLTRYVSARNKTYSAQAAKNTTAFLGLSGESLDTAQKTLDTTMSSLYNTTWLYEKVARILRITARGAATLERIYKAVVASAQAIGVGIQQFTVFGLGQKIIDNSEILSDILTTLRSMGRALDAACARQIAAIEALCTDIAPPNFVELGDLHALSSRDIHEIALLSAPPRVHDLARTYPAATILESGTDHAVIAFGEIDTATSITTIVGGVGASTEKGWASYTARAHDVYQHTRQPTIMWLGYSAPTTIFHAATSTSAQIGGAQLATFQASLRKRAPDAHLAVLGHSYGSTVAGHAATGSGLDADSLILAGSPGTAQSLTLNSSHPRVISSLGSLDVIGLTGTNRIAVHGKDPSAAISSYEQWPISGGHGSYFTNEDFLTNLDTELKQGVTHNKIKTSHLIKR